MPVNWVPYSAIVRPCLLLALGLFLAASVFAQSPLGETIFSGPVNSESIAEDTRGNLYITGENGLFRLTGSRYERLDHDPAFGVPGPLAFQLIPGQFGCLWIGTTTGLWSYDGTNFRHHPQVARRTISDLAVRPDGTLAYAISTGESDDPYKVWAGMLRTSDQSVVQSANLGTTTRLSHLAFDSVGSLYFATMNGLYFLRASDFPAFFSGINRAVRLPYAASSGGGYFSAHVAADPSGGVLVYGKGQITRYVNADQGPTYQLESLLPNAATGQQICFAGGQIWFLSRFVPHTLKDGRFLKFQPESPFISTVFRHIHCDAAQNILIGQNVFIRRLDSRKLLSQSGLHLRVQTGTSGWLNAQSPRLRLPFGEHALFVEAGAPRLVSVDKPESVNYRFRLTGVEKEWRVSPSPQITFAVSKSGHYRLEADIERNGKWSNEPAAFEFDVASRPIPFWAWPLFATALAALAVATFLWRQRRRESAWGIPNTLLGNRYRITDKLAETNISFVFRALDTRLAKRPMALKVIRQTAVEKTALSAFRREVEALSRLRHRGIVAIQDIGVLNDGRPFLVMELVEGINLRTILRDGPVDRQRIARIIIQLGETMAIAHSNGILHRDLKPENLMIEFPGTVRENLVILDFGTARILSPDGSIDSYPGGTLDYMAPEQLFGHSSPKTDIYAASLLAFEMLTGKRLTELMCDNPKDVDQALRRELTAVQPSVAPAAIDAILIAANPDPSLRPASISAWATNLSSYLVAPDTI